MNAYHRIPRRTVLKGLGTAIALPWLEAMMPRTLRAEVSSSPPTRMAFIYAPNGKNMADWTPARTGTEFDLPAILEPLKEFKDDFSVLSGLTLDKARANGDGPGDHARSLAAFLTCCQPRKTHGADIRAGISVDQIAAQKMGQESKFSSLEIGCDPSAQSGNCDSGYSCAYSSNISWRGESTPQAKEINPRLVFERLFLDPNQQADQTERVRRERYRKSVLDFVAEDAKRLQNKLGVNDQRKLDEYLSSVREIEQRIDRAQNSTPQYEIPDYPKPTGIPKDYQEHIRLMCDMMVLAFQADVTRISTFVLANEGSNKSYRFIDVPEGHHDLSHHGNDEAKKAKIRKINTFHTTQLAYLVGKLKGIREGDGTLLDHCMLVYGSGISDGNRHNHDDLPILLIGRGNGTIRPGRHIQYPKETPLANLYLSMLERIGVQTDKLGDSTGKLLDLDA